MFEQDAKMIVDTVLAIHPKIDWKNPKIMVEQAVDVFLSSAKACDHIDDFFKLAQPFFKAISDAHSTIQKPEKIYRHAPIILEEIENHVIIKDFDPQIKLIPQPLSVNDRLIAINGVSVENLIQDLMKKEVFNVDAYGRWIAINQLLHTEMHIESLELTCMNHKQEQYIVQCPLFDINDPVFSSWQLALKKKEIIDGIKIDIFDDVKSGYIKYSTCKDRSIPMFLAEANQLGLSEEQVPKLDVLCDQLMMQMNQKDYQNLIIDLRGNEGGDARLGYEIMKRITKQRIISYGHFYHVSERLKSYFEKTIHFYPTSHQNMIETILNTQTGTVCTQEPLELSHPYTGELPKHFCYECQVFVLINERVYSSGEWLAVELKDNHLATFIGTPTGGGGSVPGDTITFRTPFLKVLFDVSYRFFNRPNVNAKHNETVIPDYQVQQLLIDCQQNIDTLLTFTKELIKKTTTNNLT